VCHACDQVEQFRRTDINLKRFRRSNINLRKKVGKGLEELILTKGKKGKKKKNWKRFRRININLRKKNGGGICGIW
jgi:urocanate hydratase